MKVAEIKLDEKSKLYADGHYEFEMDEKTIQNSDKICYKRITFGWDAHPNLTTDYSSMCEELFELLGERLKQDFISFLNTKTAQHEQVIYLWHDYNNKQKQ